MTNGSAEAAVEATEAAARKETPPRPEAPPLQAFVVRSLDWLAAAQQENGGWGGGSHAQQQNRNAHTVPTDPATTAVAAMAMMRAGNGLDHGPYADNLRRATDWMLATIEQAPDEGPQITALNGTQPQAKMGQNVDTALAAQYLSRLLSDLGDDAELRPRIEGALDKCLQKIQSTQSDDGSWAAGGWAPVLQSSQMCTALELAQLAGRPVDADKLAQARDYQKNLVRSGGAPVAAAGAPAGGSVATLGFPATGAPAAAPEAMAGPALDSMFDSVSTGAAAGIPLYAYAANMRNVVAQSRAAEQIIEEAKDQGVLQMDAEVDEKALQAAGVDGVKAKEYVRAFQMNTASKMRAFDERVLSGFGNNGGEEFLSYQMKSESLVIDGGEEWSTWIDMMRERLAKVQNEDGSWSGHHCITSPVFCTASAISCLTADRDVDWLQRTGELARR